MPDENGTTEGTLQPGSAADAPPPRADDGTSGFHPWLLIALLGVAVLVSIQNLWLRRRGEERDAERRAADEEGP